MRQSLLLFVVAIFSLAQVRGFWITLVLDLPDVG
jgi:hypothetical protein